MCIRDSPRTAPTGNLYGAMGMLVAVVVTIAQMDFGETNNFILIISGLVIGGFIGYLMAIRVQMTGMPEMVALFNGFGGAASALVAASEVFRRINENDLPEGLELHVAWTAIGLSALVGWVTLTGSLLAMMKLKDIFRNGIVFLVILYQHLHFSSHLFFYQ